MDKKYWNAYYEIKKQIDYPSSCANFCFEKEYLKKDMSIVEIGCGDGRDAKFFASKGIFVHAIDQSKTVIQRNKGESEFLSYKQNIKYHESNFVEFASNFSDIDCVYSRFILHSINENDQNKVFEIFYEVLKKSGLFLIEFRTNKDSLFKKGTKISLNETFTDHYRRFIDSKQIRNHLDHKIGFKINYFVESDNLAVHGDDNPVIVRLVLQK